MISYINNKRLVLFFEPHALYYFFLKTVVAKELLHYSVAKKTRTQTHTHTHTMSAKLMDATPDLKRLAPVENLAIDVISYAHGSVTPTLTHLYSKGKDSFLKVRRRQRRDTKKCTGVPFSFLSFSLSLSCFCRTHERYARRVRVNLRTVGRLNCTQCDDLCASVNGLFKSFSRRLEF